MDGMANSTLFLLKFGMPSPARTAPDSCTHPVFTAGDNRKMLLNITVPFISINKMGNRPWLHVIFFFLYLQLFLGVAIGDSHAVPKSPQWLGHFVVNSERSMLIASTAHNSSRILFWSLTDGALEHEVRLGDNWVRDMNLSPDGTLLAVALSSSKEIGCYSIQQRKWLWKIKSGDSMINSSIRFAGKGEKLIYLGIKKFATYDVQTGRMMETWTSPVDIRKGYSCLSTTGRYAAIWGPGWAHNDHHIGPFDYLRAKWLYVLDTDKNEPILEASKMMKPFKYCGGAFTHDDQYFVLGAKNGLIQVWSLRKGNVVREWQAYGKEGSPFRNDSAMNSVDSLLLSKDGRLLASLGHDTDMFYIKIWDFETHTLLKTFRMDVAVMSCSLFPMAFSSDSNFFVIEQNEQLCLYDTKAWLPKWCKDRKMDGSFY